MSAREGPVATTPAGTYTRRLLYETSVAKTHHEAHMEVQIFGVKKSADTRKAIRFFSERRIRAHFVDLLERQIASGELQRFIQKFGIEALLDRDSIRVEELGLRHAQLSPARWSDKLALEPLLLRMPLVRRLGQPAGLTIGLDEETWKAWHKIETSRQHH